MLTRLLNASYYLVKSVDLSHFFACCKVVASTYVISLHVICNNNELYLHAYLNLQKQLVYYALYVRIYSYKYL